jgi:hypothetical protein
MKYEISQQQYVDFLNTLTYAQQASLTAIAPNSAAGTYVNSSGSNRNKLKIKTAGTNNTIPAVYETEYPYVASNRLSWNDVAAYLDWSALRPMTELEFEKACRGATEAVANEYAWGSINSTLASAITNGGAATETASTTGTNAFYDATGSLGPMRVGAFAKSSATREQSGASFYGIMDMSGNISEKAVTVGNAAGRAFEGNSGDGELSETGYANTLTWPGTDASGTGLRGGDWYNGSGGFLTSMRHNACYTVNDRYSNLGGRGVRSCNKFNCGENLNIIHQTIFGVAPVYKQVTYETILSSLSNSNKCWITRNLGASQQAATYNDNTEASAGWYWQFNRKQGYKHDGSSYTPSVTWITSINENANWTPEQNPCALELGSGWRIPTDTEWYNVRTHWYSSYAYFNSVMKLHLSGYLSCYGGGVYHRGDEGHQWTSTQQGNTASNAMYLFNSGSCSGEGAIKPYGYSIRCIKD